MRHGFGGARRRNVLIIQVSDSSPLLRGDIHLREHLEKSPRWVPEADQVGPAWSAADQHPKSGRPLQAAMKSCLGCQSRGSPEVHQAEALRRLFVLDHLR